MSSSPTRPSFVIDLPPHLDPLAFDTTFAPRTPEHLSEQPAVSEPPPPPRQTFKLRRKRASMPFQEPEVVNDTVIPTIEMSEAVSEMSSPMLHATPSSHGLLAPMPSIQRLVTPPKTPAPRMSHSEFGSPTDNSSNEWSMINKHRTRPGFERAGSICSSFSDSSISSCGSSAFSAPNGGSCTSPDYEPVDPFTDDSLPTNVDPIMLSPTQHNSSPTAKRVKTHRLIKWTPQMDDHLWQTYARYLSDPRVTPFKMLPGTCPPLGVCSRVATKARRTWSQYRAATPSLDAVMATDFMREGSPDTIRPEKEVKNPQWPRSDSNTRRRLRTLCKKKPSLSIHYQRLLVTRSPSPFQSSSSTSRNSEPPQTSKAFSSRDLNVSLTAATAPSMQPEGPLAQLAGDETPRPESSSSSKRDSRPVDWFARIGRSQAHQKSMSLQSGLSLEAPTPRRPVTLASPLDLERRHLLERMVNTKSLGRNEFDRKHGKTPSLDAPVELNGAPTMPRSLKRRFRPDEDKPRRPGLEDVFGPSVSENNVIARNRGFSTGAVRASDKLTNLFTPPSTVRAEVDQTMAEAPSSPPASLFSELPLGARSAPRRLAEPIPRLGSPFVEAASTDRGGFNTFPRSYIPSMSNPQPFQQRLRELAAQRPAHK